MDVNSLTAKKIKELRLSTGLSQLAFSKKIGITASQQYRIESASIDITLRTAELFAKHFSIPLSEVICQKVEKTTNFIQPIGLQNGENNSLHLNITKDELEQVVNVVEKLKKNMK
jgi:transcriptional regulator with XRE-family HTH domain